MSDPTNTEPDHAPTTPPGTPSAASRARVPIWAVAVIGAAALVIGIGATVGIVTAVQASQAAAAKAKAANAKDHLFSNALKACGDSSEEGFDISDGHRTLSINMRGEDETEGTSYTEEKCVLQQLHITNAILDQMGQTRALDGRQHASWGNYDITWSYHPDDGLDSIVTLN